MLIYSLFLASVLSKTITTLVGCTTTICANSTATSSGFKPIEAECVLSPAVNSTIKGTVSLLQTSEDFISISYNVTGSDANAQRGFHIHSFGDMTDGSASTGSHYNPFHKTHGNPDSADRHVGDLPMIKADSEGSAHGTFTDSIVKLFGEYSVLGRALVIHAGVDDYGSGGNTDSLTTGNAGARKACCVIGLKNTA